MIPSTSKHSYLPSLRCSSKLLLFRLLTGHRWNITLSELAFNTPNCSTSQTYQQLASEGPKSCGEDLGFLFILFYIIVSRFVILNLITVLVIDGYLESRKLENMPFKDIEVDRVLQQWAFYDPERTGLIKCDDFILFLYSLPEPFGVDKIGVPVRTKDIVDRFFSSEDNKIIVTNRDVLDTSKRFPLVVYEIKNEHFIHFVDYISFITNKASANFKHLAKYC